MNVQTSENYNVHISQADEVREFLYEQSHWDNVSRTLWVQFSWRGVNEALRSPSMAASPQWTAWSVSALLINAPVILNVPCFIIIYLFINLLIVIIPVLLTNVPVNIFNAPKLLPLSFCDSWRTSDIYSNVYHTKIVLKKQI